MQIKLKENLSQIFEKNNEIEEEAKLRALKKKFSSYILSMPNISNSLAAKVKEENSLEKLTDIIVNLLPLTFDIKLDFVKETNSIIRADLLLDILSKEKEVNELERNIENELKIELDKSQKEYILSNLTTKENKFSITEEEKERFLREL